MARHPIVNKHGQTTTYFWTDEHVTEPAKATIFREAEDGVKKMRGVYFDRQENKVVKQ